MEKIIAKYKFEFFSVDTYLPYNKWPLEKEKFRIGEKPNQQLFNMSSRGSVPEGKLFTVDKRRSYVSEEYWKKHSFSLLTDVRVKRVTIILSKNEKKNQIKLSVFSFMKGKKTGKRYYWKTSHNSHISFNTKIKDFFLINQLKRGPKWFNNITRNNFRGVGRELFSLPAIIENLLLQGNQEKFEFHRERIENAWHDILCKLQKELDISQSFIKTNYPSSILNHIILPWFLSKKQFKLPNNYKNLLIEHYPGIKCLRRNKMNLGAAVLKYREIYSKYSIKLLNTEPNFNIWSYKNILESFGSHNIKKFNKDLFLGNPHFSSMLDEENISILTPKEKCNIIKLFNLTLEGSIDIGDIIDHVYLKNRLKRKDIKVKVKANTVIHFHEEHLDWSTQLAKAQRIIETTYNYNPLFVDEVEGVIKYNHHKYYPFILKDDLEYNEEGTYQKHCVGSYIDRYNCHIISLRKDDGTRLTLEYKIDVKKRVAVITQQKLKHNHLPNEEWSKVIYYLHETITHLVREGIYIEPKIIRKHLKRGTIEEVSKDDNLKDNEYLLELDTNLGRFDDELIF